jgi:hypothetical protein
MASRVNSPTLLVDAVDSLDSVEAVDSLGQRSAAVDPMGDIFFGVVAKRPFQPHAVSSGISTGSTMPLSSPPLSVVVGNVPAAAETTAPPSLDGIVIRTQRNSVTA